MLLDVSVISVVRSLQCEGTKDFPWIMGRHSFRLSESPKISIVVFRSGKILIYGGDGAESQYQLLMDILNRVGSETSGALKVLNQVLKARVCGKVDLIASYGELLNCEYEPEQFPGLIVRGENGLTMLVFYSGSVILTGIKGDAIANPELISEAVDWSNELVMVR